MLMFMPGLGTPRAQSSQASPPGRSESAQGLTSGMPSSCACSPTGDFRATTLGDARELVTLAQDLTSKVNT